MANFQWDSASPPVSFNYGGRRIDLDAGLVMLFRRHESPFPTMEVELKDIDESADYRVSPASTYCDLPYNRMKGSDLRRMTNTIGEQPGTMLIRYEKVKM